MANEAGGKSNNRSLKSSALPRILGERNGSALEKGKASIKHVGA